MTLEQRVEQLEKELAELKNHLTELKKPTNNYPIFTESIKEQLSCHIAPKVCL